MFYFSFNKISIPRVECKVRIFFFKNPLEFIFAICDILLYSIPVC